MTGWRDWDHDLRACISYLIESDAPIILFIE
jgi:hypothetical protein